MVKIVQDRRYKAGYRTEYEDGDFSNCLLWVSIIFTGGLILIPIGIYKLIKNSENLDMIIIKLIGGFIGIMLISMLITSLFGGISETPIIIKEVIKVSLICYPILFIIYQIKNNKKQKNKRIEMERMRKEEWINQQKELKNQFVTNFTVYITQNKRSKIKDCAIFMGLSKEQLLQNLNTYSNEIPRYVLTPQLICAQENQIKKPILEEKTNYCEFCGTSFLSNAQFCNNCGNGIEQTSIQNSELGASRYIPNNIKMEVWNRDGGKCVRCGINKSLQYDHIIPFSKGGASSVENLQLLCANCNTEKRDKIDG